MQIEEIGYGMWIGMIAIAILGLFGITTNTESAKLLNPTTRSFIQSLQIVFAEVTQIFVFKHFPSPISLVGASVVVIAVILKGVEGKLVILLPNRCRTNRPDFKETRRI